MRTRKRVTRAGRGAHAIYLPKAWLDEWSPEQRKASEVDLLTLDEHLLLSPVIPTTHPSARLASTEPDDLVRLLLSAYVTGHHTFTVERREGFTDAQIVEGRRFLRLLDERIDAEWGTTRIRFTRARAPESERAGLAARLADLTSRVVETAHALSELLEFFPHNPARVLHAVHLIVTIERDDLQRLKNQGYRAVARLELPATRVADLQLYLLASHVLARMGKIMVEAAETMSDHFGIPRDRLHYPPELLAEGLTRPRPAGPAFRAFLGRARDDLQDFIEGLLTMQDMLRLAANTANRGGIDGSAALASARKAREHHERITKALRGIVQEQWGPAFVQEDPQGIYRVAKAHVHVQDLHEELRTLADRIADFTLAETLEHDA